MEGLQVVQSPRGWDDSGASLPLFLLSVPCLPRYAKQGLPALSVSDTSDMRISSLFAAQRILEAEQTLIEAVGSLEEPIDEQRQQEPQQHREGGEGDEENETEQADTTGGGNGAGGSAAARETESSNGDAEAESKTNGGGVVSGGGGDKQVPEDNENKSEGSVRGGGGEQKYDEAKGGTAVDAAAADRVVAADGDHCAAADAKGTEDDHGDGRNKRASGVASDGSETAAGEATTSPEGSTDIDEDGDALLARVSGSRRKVPLGHVWVGVNYEECILVRCVYLDGGYRSGREQGEMCFVYGVFWLKKQLRKQRTVSVERSHSRVDHSCMAGSKGYLMLVGPNRCDIPTTRPCAAGMTEWPARIAVMFSLTASFKKLSTRKRTAWHVLLQVEHIREAVAGAKALCICDELVEVSLKKFGFEQRTGMSLWYNRM